VFVLVFVFAFVFDDVDFLDFLVFLDLALGHHQLMMPRWEEI
jgi:hypothetical protein